MGYYNGIPVTSVSNTTVGNTITTVMTAGSTRITQITSYIPGNTYYRLNWQITNTGGTSLSDIRFFHGEDTFLQGGDNGAGWWEPNNKIIGVRKVVSGLEQRMSLQGITTPYGHESADFGIVANDAATGALTNVVDPLDTTDNGYALEWRQATLAAGATWTISAMEKFTSGASGALMVIAPVATDCAVGVACNLTYTINNTGLSSVTSPLTLSSAQSWDQAIISPSSPVTLAAGASVNVVVRLTVSNGTATGTQGQFTLTGNDGTAASSDIALVNVQDPAADEDGDSVPNFIEETYFTDPLNPASPVAVNPTGDDDHDGVTNAWEIILGTDPADADSNSTKTPAVDENNNGTSDANEDFDGDGIPNLIEITYGTDPLNLASPVAVNPIGDDDGDGVTNAWEIILGTDPANADSNSTKTTPNEAGNGTSDANEDFDGDGIPNGIEITYGTDPLNPNDPPKIDLEVTQTSTTVGMGNLTMTITVRNKGVNPLTGVNLSDTFPNASTSTIWSWTCVGAACSATSGTGNLNETLGTLPVNGTAVYTVTGTVANWSSWTNTATITMPLGVYDTTSANNSATVGRYQVLLVIVIMR